jgi:acetyl esterase
MGSSRTDIRHIRDPAARLDGSAERALALIRASGHPAVEHLSAPEARRVSEANRALLRPDPVAVRRVEDRAFQTPDGYRLALRAYTDLSEDHDGSGAAPGLVYFHGGGFTVGSIETHDTICREIAVAARTVVVSVAYRLGPEHRFPQAVDDAVAAVEHVARNARAFGIDPRRLAVGGDSAGGNLAAVAALSARDRGGPHVAAQVLVYPKTDYSDRGAQVPDFPQDFRFNRNLLEFFARNYLRSEADRADWRCSPLLADDHSRLPPALIITAGFDPLAAEGEDYALRLARSGVPVSMKRFPGQVHGFLGWGRVVPEASLAIKDICRFLKCRVTACRD